MHVCMEFMYACMYVCHVGQHVYMFVMHVCVCMCVVNVCPLCLYVMSVMHACDVMCACDVCIYEMHACM